jgi:hypothetical protein
VNDDYPRLRVPLEMSGTGQPRLLEWELKKSPLKGIGVLRFFGGTVEGRSGPEDVELVAIIDLNRDNIVAIEPHKQGNRVSTWTWEEGKVVIASVDGVTDEFILRNTSTQEASSSRRSSPAACAPQAQVLLRASVRQLVASGAPVQRIADRRCTCWRRGVARKPDAALFEGASAASGRRLWLIRAQPPIKPQTSNPSSF